jgi:hypothetical protein
MSLLRLLTAGQSLDGPKQPASIYRLSDQRALPKFGSERNPLARVPVPTSTKGEPARMQSQGLITSRTEKPTPSSASEGGIRIRIKSPSAPALVKPAVRSENIPAPKMATARSGVKLLDFGRTWASAGQLIKSARNLLPGNMRPGRESKAKMPSPRMLQGELLLENIKVVRNDLSDADWEIVTKKEAKRAAAPSAAVAPADRGFEPGEGPVEHTAVWRGTTLNRKEKNACH